MSDWPQRPQVGNRPVMWFADGSARPADPEPGDYFETPRGRFRWTGSEWVRGDDWMTLENPPGEQTGFPVDVTLEARP